MKKKHIWILLLALLLVAAIVLALVLALGGEDPIDSDGDGRPDDVDEEPEDNLDKDNEVNIDGFFPS